MLFSKPALIEGTLEKNVLIFYKTYPKQEGLVGASALIANRFNSASIQYTGVLKKRLFSKNRYVDGVWEIHGSYLDENRYAVHYMGKGTWRMKKI